MLSTFELDFVINEIGGLDRFIVELIWLHKISCIDGNKINWIINFISLLKYLSFDNFN